MRYLYLCGMLSFFAFLYLFYEGYFIALMALAFMVLFHEWGHFLAARACGVKVDVFSIGFGKKEWCLATFKWGDTEYRLTPLLLGGYVSMKGQEDLDPTKQDDSPDSYNMQPPYKRILILLAGPFANLLLGCLALVIVSFLGKEEIAPIIAEPEPNTPAFMNGLRAGDEILSVNGIVTRTWTEASDAIQAQTGAVEFIILRNGKENVLMITPEIKVLPNIFNELVERPVIGVRPLPLTTINEPYDYAQALGLEKNDVILAINGQKVWNFNQIDTALSHLNAPLEIKILRNHQEKILKAETIQPEISSASTLGIKPLMDSIRVVRYEGLAAIEKGFDRSVKMVSLMMLSLKKLIMGVVPTSELGGVVMIMQVTSSAAESGIVALLTIGALISLNLGIVNLLPIPMLDGGHIVFNLYEMFSKKALKPEVLYRFTVAGAIIVVSLMCLGLYNDINRLFNE